MTNIKIKKHFQLEKDLDNPNIVYMPQSMRDQIKTQEEFDENYTNKMINRVHIKVVVLSDLDYKKFRKRKTDQKRGTSR